MDIQKDIPSDIFEEVEPVEKVLNTIEDCFYASDIGNMSLHLLTTENEDEYYIQRYIVGDDIEWFKCIDVEKLRQII